MSLNWGILGAGNIAGQFTRDLVKSNLTSSPQWKHRVVSVGSLDAARGAKFIEANGISGKGNDDVVAKVESYDDLYANPDVDVVYVATPHVFHKEQVIKALEAGKHVLCEKPITVSEKDAAELTQLAKEKGKFLMEGVWTRFFPAVQELKKLVFDQQAIGTVNRLFSDFAYNGDGADLPTLSRVRDIKLGAGSLLDIGIYSLTWARLLLDNQVGDKHTPFKVVLSLYLDPEDGVDHKAAFIVQYQNGGQGILSSSELSDGPSPFARLEGSKGHIEIFAKNPAAPEKFIVHYRDGREPYVWEDKSGFQGFIYEANAVADDIKAGRLESLVMPHAETLLVMKTMDEIRKALGLKYPQDN